MAGLVTATLDSVRSFTGSIAWAPLVRVSRAAILSLLTGLEVGQLTIRDKDGTDAVDCCAGSVLVASGAICGHGQLASRVSLIRSRELKSLPGLRRELHARRVRVS